MTSIWLPRSCVRRKGVRNSYSVFTSANLIFVRALRGVTTISSGACSAISRAAIGTFSTSAIRIITFMEGLIWSCSI